MYEKKYSDYSKKNSLILNHRMKVYEVYDTHILYVFIMFNLSNHHLTYMGKKQNIRRVCHFTCQLRWTENHIFSGEFHRNCKPIFKTLLIK